MVRKTALLSLIIFLIATVSYAKEFRIDKKAGEYSVTVTIDKNPPVVGKNNLEITINDSSGKAVTDAKVVIELSMPAMPGMPAHNSKYNAELKGNVYMAVIEPSMAGSWNLAARINRAGKTDTVRITFDAR